MPDVLHGTKNYVLRPEYDAVVAEFGAPPIGFPEECQFRWPETPEDELVALGQQIAAIKRDAARSIATAVGQPRCRDTNGRFTKKGDTSE